jgi:type IV pilus assembly protein PilE
MEQRTMIQTRNAEMHARLQRRARGFTLLEVMITVAIVATLAAVALPSYRDQIARGKRSDVQTALVEDAAYLQRYYAANNTYPVTGSLTPTLPAATSPRDGTTVNYNITIDQANTTATTFLLKAAPAGTMATDKCGTFTYDNLGMKGIVNGAAGQTVATCWR